MSVRYPVLSADALDDRGYLSVDVLLHTASAQAKSANLLVFRYHGQVFAYVNRCMHMQRPLDCQQEGIFDHELRFLRCSMHGFLFEPETGICISPVCQGQTLRKIKVLEEDGMLLFKEKHLQIKAFERHSHTAAGARV
jgi:nitrite reductase/ring-hydroxylating ferredoxin subunit